VFLSLLPSLKREKKTSNNGELFEGTWKSSLSLYRTKCLSFKNIPWPVYSELLLLKVLQPGGR
jgi:hypothetical protein